MAKQGGEKSVYNSAYYEQVLGAAVGSPVSAVIANMVMQDVEKRTSTTSPVKPFFWKWYVNDVYRFWIQ